MTKTIIQHASFGVPTVIYKVENIPATTTDDEVFDFCDRYAFGGDVQRQNSTAIVTTWID